MSKTKLKGKILMVLHGVPHDAPFLRNKFYLLAEERNLELLAWDRAANIKRMPSLTSEIKSRIHLGIPSLRWSDIVYHSIKSLFIFVLHPLLSLRFLFFLRREGFGLKKFVKFSPFVKINPSLVHFEYGTLGRDMIFLKRFFKFKAIVSFRGYDLNYVGLTDPLYFNPVWDMADGIHFLGHDLKIRALRRGYHGNCKEVFVSPAIDLDWFKRTTPYPQTKLPFVVLSIGRVVWKKGLEYGVRAIKRLKDIGTPVEYRILGHGDFLQAIQFTVYELGLQEEVKFLGARSATEIRKELEAAHVLLHPAVSEGFCNAVVEAQAMEVPVICTDADGLPENIADGISGFVVPKWDVEEMAAKLMKLFNERDQAQLMGRNGRHRAELHYSVSDQIKKFKTFYEELENEDIS